MKKTLKTLGWLLFILLIFCGIFAFFTYPPIDAAPFDAFAYQLSVSLFFVLVAVGLLLKLLPIRKKLRILKSNKIADECLYWFIVFFVSVIVGVTTQDIICSPMFLSALQEHNSKQAETINVIEQEAATEHETASVSTESTTALPTENIGTIYETATCLPTEQINVAEETPTSLPTEEKKTIEETMVSVPTESTVVSKKETKSETKKTETTPPAETSAKSSDTIETTTSQYVFDPSTGNWHNTITLNEDIMIYNKEEYVDAEGYLNPGVEIYSREGDELEKIGKVKDIKYNYETEGTFYPYAVKIDYYDDDSYSGWYDGYTLLKMNKSITGNPIYYIKVSDKNRRIEKEEIDYDGNILWKPLKRVKNLVGAEVYLGALKSKSYTFTIVSIDKYNNHMQVMYPGGSIQTKSYNAIINNPSLFVKAGTIEKE